MNNYYNINAKEFFNGTVNADVSQNYTDFLARMPIGGKILDAGCGSGRDSLNFMKAGYEVAAMDASVEMCKLASEHIGKEVLYKSFQEIEFTSEFDGIWACATLLHVPSKELEDVLIRLKNALKPNGILYASFKYGDFEGERNGRFFHNLKEETAEAAFTKSGLKIDKMWITGDVREGRGDEKWLNLLASRK